MIGQRILRHAAWYLILAYDRKDIGESADLLFALEGMMKATAGYLPDEMVPWFAEYLDKHTKRWNEEGGGVMHREFASIRKQLGMGTIYITP